ncbi:MAG: hypothetical protein JO307_33995 [Bryobacterales bacterium]|nr:hypothetical protein [Bryobacterales bacterium]MBV9399638.1 hypothetical protein [Bryobacterales bacterium]
MTPPLLAHEHERCSLKDALPIGPIRPAESAKQLVSTVLYLERSSVQRCVVAAQVKRTEVKAPVSRY